MICAGVKISPHLVSKSLRSISAGGRLSSLLNTLRLIARLFSESCRGAELPGAENLLQQDGVGHADGLSSGMVVRGRHFIGVDAGAI